MTENHPKRLTYITMRSSISPPDSGMHAIDKLIVSGGRMSYNQGKCSRKSQQEDRKTAETSGRNQRERGSGDQVYECI